MCLIVFVLGLVICIFKYDYPIIINRWLPLKPRAFIASLPLVVLIFLFLERLNGRYNLNFINKYSKISYDFMLLQHVVINMFVKFLDIEKFSKFGVVFVLLLICLVTLYLSKRIKEVYKPIEVYLNNKF